MPKLDPQSWAFREATEADSWDGDLAAITGSGEAAYREPITDLGHVTLPEDYEAAGWDEGREQPKDIREARAALHARIDDPSAPDTEAERGAYDNLEDA